MVQLINKRRHILVLILVLAFVLAGCSEHARARPRLVVLDVGQGDAIYIRTPSGADLLIDAGRGEQVIEQLSQQMPFSDRSIELAVVTHFDSDHSGGFEQVLDRLKVTTFATNGATPNNQTGTDLLAKARQSGTKYLELQRGTRLEGAGFILDVLWPPDASDPSNAGSIVLLLRTAKQSVLLTGDADGKVEAALLEQHTPLLAGLLKAGHHGSKTSSTTEFIEAVAGSQAAISVGANNRYGHPTKETIERLQAAGYQIKRTDQDGPLTFLL
ncbi:MAG: MBL fold metallo-hydrolase [Parcubacteria group bacterium]